MYKKIRIVLAFLIVFCLFLNFVFVPSAHAVLVVDDYLIGGIVTAIAVAAGVSFVSQNTSGQTLGNYFASKVNSYVSSLGSTISDTFSGSVDYNSEGIQLDNSFQTSINNFINWWVGDTQQTTGTPTNIINDLYINGQNVTNQTSYSSNFPSASANDCLGSFRASFKCILPDGSLYESSFASFPYSITSVNTQWSIIPDGSKYIYSIHIYGTYGTGSKETTFDYYRFSPSFSITETSTESTTTTIPDDFSETIVSFVPSPSGNGSGKNNIDLSDVGFAVAGGAYTVETLRDEINALYNRVVTDTPTEIIITIIPEQVQPSPSPQVTPSPTPVIPYIPSGYEDWYQSLHDDITDLTEQTEDIKEQLECTPDTSFNYQVDLTTVFPFSIPFDIHRLVQAFNADPVAPHIVIPFNVPSINLNYTFDLDFSQFNSLAIILRNLEFVAFCVGLAILTGKVIKW